MPYFAPPATSVAYTAPTKITNETYENVGTVTNNHMTYFVIGKVLHVEGHFTAGTPAASAFAITLPNSYTIDTTKYTSDSNQQLVGQMTRYASGFSFPSTATGIWPLFYDGSTTGKVFLSIICGTGTNVYNKAFGTGFIASGQFAAYRFQVFIT
jgi:hypothetical protein